MYLSWPGRCRSVHVHVFYIFFLLKPGYNMDVSICHLPLCCEFNNFEKIYIDISKLSLSLIYLHFGIIVVTSMPATYPYDPLQEVGEHVQSSSWTSTRSHGVSLAESSLRRPNPHLYPSPHYSTPGDIVQ
jgi:hypothetical protein